MCIEMVPACLDHQSTFIFLGDFVPGHRKNYIVKARFIGSQPKLCHSYCIGQSTITS